MVVDYTLYVKNNLRYSPTKKSRKIEEKKKKERYFGKKVSKEGDFVRKKNE